MNADRGAPWEGTSSAPHLCSSVVSSLSNPHSLDVNELANAEDPQLAAVA